jgi:hypothetical protein
MEENRECFFCGSTEIRLHEVGISMGITGADYWFCGACLEGMTADEFWRKFFEKNDWRYPPMPGDKRRRWPV